MSSFDVEGLPEAEAEAREAFLWYFERSPIAADAFRVELFDAIDGLTDTATRQKIGPKTRMALGATTSAISRTR